MTYYVSGEVDFASALTLEGGTVIKLNPNTYSYLVAYASNVVCQTGPYRPAVFTSQNDDSIGEPLPNSDGTPAIDLYFDIGLALYGSGGTYPLSHLRMAYCSIGLYVEGAGTYEVKHVQFIHVPNPVFCVEGYLRLQNALMWDVPSQAFFLYGGASASAEHLTLHDAASLHYGPDAAALCLTNALLVGVADVTNVPPIFATNAVRILGSNAPVFQTVAGGSHYLATNSPYRHQGTTNISPNLLRELAHLTTYPPVLFQNTNIVVGMVLGPQAPRNTGAPDLGYHYPPLDYIFGGATLSAPMRWLPGTAVGWGEPVYSTGFGISLEEGSSLSSEGTLDTPNYFARFSTVQEGGATNWNDGGSIAGLMGNGSGTEPWPLLTARFTQWSTHVGSGGHLREGWIYFRGAFQHCEFYSGYIASYQASPFSFTNCLLDRVWFHMEAGSLYERTVLHHGGSTELFRWYADPTQLWTVQDTVFDETWIDGYDAFNADPAYTTTDHNAFLNGTYSLGAIWVGASDLVTNLTWEMGPLGPYYQTSASPLINAGSTNADQLGLYHFTTQTSQEKETNSLVDIGLHYVAMTNVNGAWIPNDTDRDGLPDYLEDLNGNGVLDTGETNWLDFDTDYDGVTDGQEVTDGTDPLNPADVRTNRLAYWNFNDASFAGERGQQPLANSNVFCVPAWLTQGAWFNSPSNTALSYRDVEEDRSANLNCRNGTVRFWFKPDWISGSGPTNEARFIEIGTNGSPAAGTNGWWALSLDRYGTNLFFSSQTNQAGSNYLTARVGWTNLVWQQIVFTYSPTNAALYVNGVLLATNTGVSLYPPQEIRATGFTVGSSAGQTNQVRGIMEDLETFNYPLTSESITNDYEAARPVPTVDVNRVQTENAITGTSNWQLFNPVTFSSIPPYVVYDDPTYGTYTNIDGLRCWPTNDADPYPEIEGFASATSVNVRDALTLYVDLRATNGYTNFTVEMFRMGWYGGLGGRQMSWTDTNGTVRTNLTLPGHRQPVPGINPTNGLIDCLLPAPANPGGPWQPTYTFTIPSNWVSGIYLAKLTTGTDVTPQTTGRQSYIIFVVREDARPSDFLFQASTTTYEAYNLWGGRSLYPVGVLNTPYATNVSFNRPYGFARFTEYNGYYTTGGIGTGDFLANASGAPSWEYNMVRWIERQGYDVTYCDNLDTHRGAPAGKPIKAFLSVGHDEYWSASMRAHVEAARDRGVNLGFFAANVCFWLVQFEAGERVFSVDKNGENHDNGQWRKDIINNHEISLIGVEYAYNSLDSDIKMPNPLPSGSGCNGLHWAYDYTGLTNGQVLVGLLGYEVDGIISNTTKCNCSGSLAPDTNTVILAASPFDCFGGCGPGSGLSFMTFYTNSSGARVFATGSMQWNWGLDDFGFQIYPGGTSRVHWAAQQMTHNVLRTYSDKGRAPVILINVDAGTEGNWTNRYGPSYWIADISLLTNLPTYAQVTLSNQTTQVWTNLSSDPRALLLPSSTNRIASAWTTTDTQGSAFTINLNLADTNTHQVALYCADWLGTGTILENVEVFESSDTSFSNPLDTRSFQLPSNGVYLVWSFAGSKVIRITKQDAAVGNKAMVSGLFLGP